MAIKELTEKQKLCSHKIPVPRGKQKLMKMKCELCGITYKQYLHNSWNK